MRSLQRTRTNMGWESYHREIIKAKEEYDQTIKPIINILEHAHKEAWDRYIMRITQAEKFLPAAPIHSASGRTVTASKRGE